MNLDLLVVQYGFRYLKGTIISEILDEEWCAIVRRKLLFSDIVSSLM